MSDTQIRDFTRGSIPKQLFSFAWPLFLSNLLQVVYNMIDMMIVGNVLSKSGLSAVSVGGDVSNFLTFVAMGFSNAGQVLIARYIGARERHKLGKFVGNHEFFSDFLRGLSQCGGSAFSKGNPAGNEYPTGSLGRGAALLGGMHGRPGVHLRI